MNNDVLFAGLILLIVCTVIGCITAFAVIEVSQEHEYRMTQLECTPPTERNEWGQDVSQPRPCSVDCTP